MYDGGDILLFALSARRTTPWAAFKNCIDTVHRRNRAIAGYEQDENATAYRWRALRVLSCLGHIDLRFNSGAIEDVVVAPPVLVALPGFGIRKAVLCGARSPDTVQELRKAAALNGVAITVHTQSKTNPYIPTRVEVQAENDAYIRAAAESLGICYSRIPPARWISEVSATLQDYCQGLNWSEEEDLNWDREDFDIDKLRFRQPSEDSSPLRLSRYQNPVTSLWRYRLWSAGRFSTVELDWGRFAILAMFSRHVLRYDRATRRVLVPSGTPLPTLMARALGLCSGHAPEFIRSERALPPAHVHHYDVFRDVPPSIFRAVSGKMEGPLT